MATSDRFEDICENVSMRTVPTDIHLANPPLIMIASTKRVRISRDSVILV